MFSFAAYPFEGSKLVYLEYNRVKYKKEVPTHQVQCLNFLVFQMLFDKRDKPST